MNQRCDKLMKIRDFKKDNVYLVTVLFILALSFPVLAQTPSSQLAANDWDSFSGGAQAVCSDDDIDNDDDGLIELCFLEDLDAVRYVLDGSGYKASASTTKSTQGCPSGGCKGYELVRDLDFKDDASYRDIANKERWTTGTGWAPIGYYKDYDDDDPFRGTFEGNGYSICNLMINRSTTNYVGLFSVISTPTVIHRVGLLNAEVVGLNYVGTLVGAGHKRRGEGEPTDEYYKNSYRPAIANSYSTGKVHGYDYVGGLIGISNPVMIVNSYSIGSVIGRAHVSGLAGGHAGIMTNSYSIGSVIGTGQFGPNGYGIGGLVGSNNPGIISNSYSMGTLRGSTSLGCIPVNSMGGLVDNNREGSISNSYSVGTFDIVVVPPRERYYEHCQNIIQYPITGGLAAFNLFGGKIATSYWDVTTSQLRRSAGGAGKTTEQLQLPTTASGLYSTWSEADWDFGNTKQYPALKYARGPDPSTPMCDITGTPICGTVIGGQRQGSTTTEMAATINIVNRNPSVSEGDLVTLSAEVQGSAKGIMEYRWTQASGPNVLSAEVLVTTKTLQFRVPKDLVVSNGSTTLTFLLSTAFSKGMNAQMTAVRVQKIDNGQIADLGAPTQQAGSNILVAPPVDLSTDADGAGRITAYQWQRRTSGSSWLSIRNATSASYTLALTTNRGASFRVQISYVDGQDFVATVHSAQLRPNLPSRVVVKPATPEQITKRDWSEFPGGAKAVCDDADIDNDDDGLIEICYLEGLDAIRYALDGSGYRSSSSTPTSTQGCASGGCIGYELVRDLDFKDGTSYRDIANKERWTTGTGWTPIGTWHNSFRGKFEGNGYSISNLLIDRPTADQVGLFGVISSSAAIHRIGLLDTDIFANRRVGSLAGYSFYGTITNSYSSGVVNGVLGVGGFIGVNFGGIITNSYSNGKITSSGDVVGGLVGYNNARIINSYSNGKITGKNAVGGLVGWNNGDDKYKGLTRIINSYSSGSVSGYSCVGGLVGYNKKGTIINAYSTMPVNGNDEVGGLAGSNSEGTIKNSYSIGTVNGSDKVGGLVGYNSTATIVASYWDITASGIRDSAGGEGKTTVELQSLMAAVGIYSTWNDADWDFGTSKQYPALKFAKGSDLNNPACGVAGTPICGTLIEGQRPGSTPRVIIPEDWSKFPGGAKAVCDDADIDNDDDGLIEICHLEDLDAVRHVLDGSGYKASASASISTRGCASGGCRGYELVRDLDFQDDASYRQTANKEKWTTGVGWTPITGPYPYSRFSGRFEGNGYTLSNLMINSLEINSGVGLFYAISSPAVINRVGLLNVEISGYSHVGSLVSINHGTITNSYSSGSVREKGTIGKRDSRIHLPSFVGGLVGWQANSSAIVANSYSSASVNGHSWVGGLVGGSQWYATIANSYSSGSVSGVSYVGGLVGRASASTIVNSYSSSSVSGDDHVGGLVGSNLNMFSEAEGRPLVKGVITNSYSIGSVKGDTKVGGLVGFNIGIITASYWNTETSGMDTSAGGEGKTTVQLQSPTAATGIYSDWSNADWDFGTSKQYPALRYTRGPDLNNPACGVAGTPVCGTLIAGQRQRFTGEDWSKFPGGAQAVCDDADIDNDDDGLIEICYLEGLDAIRYVLDGSGYKVSASASTSTRGCASGGCRGYELVRDLDFQDDASYRQTANKEKWTTGVGWTPITGPYPYSRFSGRFEGNGYTLSNLMINSLKINSRVSLFGAISSPAVINRVGLLNVEISGYSYVGSLASISDGGTITNSYSSGSVSEKGTIGERDTRIDPLSSVGGLVGWIQNGATIANSYSSASVSGYSRVGGLVGWSQYRATIANSYSSGSVSGYKLVGGLVGVHGYGTISNSYSTGPVSGLSYVGGLVGSNINSLLERRPVLKGVITNSYSIGSVKGDTDVGGLVGFNGGIITASYWNTETSGMDTSAGGAGKTTAQLQSPTAATGIYSGWSNADWDFGNSKQYPALRYTRGSDLNNPACGVAGTPACGTLIAGQRQRFTGEDWSEFPGGAKAVCDDTDIDNDDDGLIEICYLEGLDAIRYVLDGSGYKASASASTSTQGCASGGCRGYELVRNLDFKLDSSYRNTANKAQWTTTSTGGWLPIGKENNGFSGTFDGNGYTLSNLVIDRTSLRVGLFGQLSSGAIAGIGLLNINVRGSTLAGGLVGSNQSGTITNSYSVGRVSGHEVGGLVGYNWAGAISNSYSRVSVNGVHKVGGLVGTNIYGAITNSYSIGKVSGYNQLIGGLVGWNKAGTINHSYSMGQVSGWCRLGGLVGTNSGGTIRSSYSSGSVSGKCFLGGLVGENLLQGTISNSYSSASASSVLARAEQWIGGLVGSNGGTIRNSYSRGRVSGPAGESGLGIGGLVGYNYGTITASYWDITTSGMDTSAGGEGKTTAQLQSPTVAIGIYSAWANNYWYFGTSKQYPVLRYTRGFWNNPACGVAGTPVCGALIAGQGSTASEVVPTIIIDTNPTIPAGRFVGKDWSKFPGGAKAVCDDADIDNDDDGLIELCTLEDLDAVRYRLDGKGLKRDARASLDTTGCGDGIFCKGYELVRDLDFEDDDSYRDAATNKIQWTTGKGWLPIGSEFATFKRRFDGNGHSIANLLIKRPTANQVGLFSVISHYAEVYNVSLLNVDISGRKHAGSLAGYSYYGTITDSYSSGVVAGVLGVGGLIGANLGGSITNSHSSGEITSSGDVVGGLVGYNNGIITHSYSTGKITGKNAVGGLVGWNNGADDYQGAARITNSYSSGSVSGYSCVGGLVGYNRKGTIINAYSTMPVNGNDEVGGLTGSNSEGTIKNSYSIGTVNGSDKVGGLVGYDSTSTIVASYWDITASGVRTSAGGVGKTTVELQSLTTAVGIYGAWNDADWDFGTAKQYPALKYARVSDSNNSVCDVVGPPVCSTLIEGQRPVIENWSEFPGGAKAVCEDADIDNDDDGLIEICYLEDLDAIRYMANGSGYKASASASVSKQGCARDGCRGYELVRNLDFDDDDSYRTVANRVAWTTTATGGWVPIKYFRGTFDGNGHTISHLRSYRVAQNLEFEGDRRFFSNGGLFSSAYGDSGAAINRVGLLEVDINIRCRGWECYAGGLVGFLAGSLATGLVINSYVTGDISCDGFGLCHVGGLVGLSGGVIAHSYALSHVRCGGNVGSHCSAGGLAGQNLFSGSITNSYAAGTVSCASSVCRAGGLVGVNGDAIINSYTLSKVINCGGGHSDLIAQFSIGGLAGYNVGIITNSYAEDSNCAGSLVGFSLGPIVNSFVKTPEQLQSPITATGIYRAWNPAHWDFGTTQQYPVLKYARVPDSDNPACGLFLRPSCGSRIADWLLKNAVATCGSGTSVCGTLVRSQSRSSKANEVIPTIRIVNSDPASQMQFTGADWSEFAGGAEAVCEDTDIDNDDDGLIEICHLEGLDAVRYAPDGSGYKASASASITTQGCASGGCNGYELVRDLDFQDDASYRDIANKARWATGTGWTPIGGSGLNRFSGNFEGNGHSISHLRINISTLSRSSGGYHLDIGLFGYVLGTINGVGLLDVDIAVGTSYRVGALAGYNRGTITNSYSSGVVHGKFATGGLAGINYGTIAHSYSSGKVAGVRNVGGLVGWNWSGIINNSYSTGSVTGTGSRAGGLVGDNSNGIISNSYSSGSVDGGKRSGGLVGSSSGGTITASYWDITASGLLNSDGGVGKTTAQLQSLITAVGIYSAWSDADWDFGTSKQYPALKHAKGSDSDHPACGVIGASVCGTLLAGQRPQTTIVVEGETLVLDADNFFNINSTDARAFLSASSATRTAIVNNDISYHWAGEDYSSFYGKELSFRTYPTYVDNSSDTKVRRYTLEVFDWAYTTVTVTVLKVNNGDIRLGAPQSSGLVLTAPSVRLASDPDGAGSFASVRYQWQIKSAESDWTDLSFATRSSYTIPSNTASNKQFRVKVHYTDGQGFETAVFSIPVVLTW